MPHSLDIYEFVCACGQSCPTLCNPMDCSLPASSIHGDFFKQEYWSGLPFPPPGDLPDPWSNLSLLLWQADSLPLSHLGRLNIYIYIYIFTDIYMWILTLISVTVQVTKNMQIACLGWPKKFYNDDIKKKKTCPLRYERN